MSQNCAGSRTRHIPKKDTERMAAGPSPVPPQRGAGDTTFKNKKCRSLGARSQSCRGATKEVGRRELAQVSHQVELVKKAKVQLKFKNPAVKSASYVHSAEQFCFGGNIQIKNRCLQESEPLFFKIRTTAPEKFQVTPTLGIIRPGSEATPEIIVIPGSKLRSVCSEKFQVLVMIAPPRLQQQKVLTAKVQETNSLGNGWLESSLPETLNKLWNEFVGEGIFFEAHRVDLLLNPKLFSEQNYLFTPPSSQVPTNAPETQSVDTQTVEISVQSEVITFRKQNVATVIVPEPEPEPAVRKPCRCYCDAALVNTQLTRIESSIARIENTVCTKLSILKRLSFFALIVASVSILIMVFIIFENGSKNQVDFPLPGAGAETNNSDSEESESFPVIRQFVRWGNLM